MPSNKFWAAMRSHLKSLGATHVEKETGIKANTIQSFWLGRSKSLTEENLELLEKACLIPAEIKALENAPDEPGLREVAQISIDLLVEHPDNKNLLPPLCESDEAELKAGLQTEIKPIPFEVLADSGKFLVLDGNNRLRILREIGYHGTLPCIMLGNVADWPIDKQKTTIQRINLARRHLTNEQKREIARQMVARGEAVRDVAKVVGLSKSTIADHTRDIVEARQEAVSEAVADMKAVGMTDRQVAKKIGVHHSTVAKMSDSGQNSQADENDDSFAMPESIGSDVNDTEKHRDDIQSRQSPQAKKVDQRPFERKPLNEFKLPPEIPNSDREDVKEVKQTREQAVASAKAKLDEKAVLARAEGYRREIEQKKEQENKRTFNSPNDNIEWARWSWNPVTGCNCGCQYCYARDIANRFEGHFKPTLHEDRLEAPANTHIPKGKEDDFLSKIVFVCSMADLFGEWVSSEWIEKVLASIKANPQWRYLFLTKNPARYLTLDFPAQCWLGATADTQRRMDTALSVFERLAVKGVKNLRFVSCEPLLEEIKVDDRLKHVDWLIIGGRSKNSALPEFQPTWKWVEALLKPANLLGIPIYFKPNLTARPKEFPKLR